MMRSNTVAFRGVGQVVEAYKANDIAPWAIVTGMGKVQDVMFAFEEDDIEAGATMLEECLKRMKAGSSSASYSLRTYKLKGVQEIESNTSWARSFPFKLYNEEDEDYSPFEAGRRHSMREADERIKALQEQIDILKKQQEEQDEEEDKPEGMAGIISGIFNDPVMKPFIMQTIAGIVSKIIPMPSGMPAQVAGIGNGAATAPVESVLEEGQPEKVQHAVNVLCTRDPKLGDHLLKLADISVKNPGQFSMLLGMLNNF
jgi:hypothetical protein